MTRTARLKAFAKVNLGLRVLYRRPDGFHELRTVFQTISLADTLQLAFTPGRRTSVEISGAQIADNIAGKAARRVLDEMKTSGSVEMDLKKNIPAGAGLGGGSSDAAAVLLALPALAGKRVPADALARVAAEMGSDVPFFLYGGTAAAMGRGEELYPLPAPAGVNAVLIAPEVHSSTAEAYRDLSAVLASFESKVAGFQAHAWDAALPDWTNDFEPVVFARHPALRKLRDGLLRAGAIRAAMTGSGSAILGAFADRAARDRALGAFPRERVFAISFLSRSRYQAQWKRTLQSHTKGNEWPPRSLYAR